MVKSLSIMDQLGSSFIFGSEIKALIYFPGFKKI